ncbi:hypothetical protein ACLOJK_041557 [Asimina triloba]
MALMDGYGQSFSEFLGTDISNCSSVPTGITDLQAEMTLHNQEGILPDDDQLFLSLGEIPMSFVGVWDPPPQDPADCACLKTHSMTRNADLVVFVQLDDSEVGYEAELKEAEETKLCWPCNVSKEFALDAPSFNYSDWEFSVASFHDELDFKVIPEG